VFYNQKHQKLTRWGISYILDKYVKMAKEDTGFTVNFRVTPHILRQYGECRKMVSLRQACVE
jgi:site-specific recombinase XerD